jgi:hypothetical protein
MADRWSDLPFHLIRECAVSTHLYSHNHFLAKECLLGFSTTKLLFLSSQSIFLNKITRSSQPSRLRERHLLENSYILNEKDPPFLHLRIYLFTHLFIHSFVSISIYPCMLILYFGLWYNIILFVLLLKLFQLLSCYFVW